VKKVADVEVRSLGATNSVPLHCKPLSNSISATVTAWLGKVFVNTTKIWFTINQYFIDWIFIAYRYMFRSSWEHLKAVLHNTWLTDLSIWIHILVQRVPWGPKQHVARIGEKRDSYRILVGKPDGKIPLGRPRHRWVNNIKKDLR
jgi:hypothetical protein